ncbi:N-acetylmuramoyl-L-alanine amidase family protein [Frigoriflavimonas asaccharolytica]|uniref:N-acetylmuramoyl-L-alanine amidase n=1 Tax=Frigoriflavimonas asaccharolytica TaxID=2735899 RepID=A0A8J8GAZ8_9FLAO|nr:N-acetylmuramoyl-L-alanine amidase [Frigoriflavimonas asaccharolytica]NRS92635.1 N-acetylmuramoyl-L-alanine amidase [Frigoriflavimonas asaccharolytica]
MRKFLTYSTVCIFAATALFSFKNDKKIILIDAGHGGEDHGATQNNIAEKDIVLDIANMIKNSNRNEEVEIILTRDSNESLSFVDRIKKIGEAKPDLVLSIHTNKTPKPNTNIGKEIYIQENEASKKYGEILSKNFDNCPLKTQNLHILRNSTSPALVFEMGNISNENDFNYLNSDIGKREISRKILKFIEEI